MATLSLQAPAGGPHCFPWTFFVPTQFINTFGRVVVTRNINNRVQGSGGFQAGGLPRIDYNIRSATTLHDPTVGRQVTLSFTNNYFTAYTVLLQQFRAEDNPLTAEPIRVHEFLVPAAEPGPIWDHPGRYEGCIILGDAATHGWALQIRGPT